MINVKVCNVFLWLNPWNKWCYTMSGKMIQIVLSWACYTYIIYVYVCVRVCFRIALLGWECDNSLLVYCLRLDLVIISNLCSWEQMVRWITLKNLVLEGAWTQHSDTMWHWDMGFYIISIMFWICYFMLFQCLTCFPCVKKIGRPCFRSKMFSYPYLINF